MPLSSGWRCSVRKLRGSPRAARRTASSSIDVEQLVDRLEVGVDRRAPRRRAGNEPRVQVLQQDDVDLPDRLGGAVVALHQLLATRAGAACRASPISRASAVCTSNTQPVLAPAGEVVQADAQLCEEALVARDRRAPRRAS